MGWARVVDWINTPARAGRFDGHQRLRRTQHDDTDRQRQQASRCLHITRNFFSREKKISEFFLEVRMEPLSPEGGGGADEEGTGTAHADEVGPPTLRRQL
jgi:hypothetical protein